MKKAYQKRSKALKILGSCCAVASFALMIKNNVDNPNLASNLISFGLIGGRLVQAKIGR